MEAEPRINADGGEDRTTQRANGHHAFLTYQSQKRDAWTG